MTSRLYCYARHQLYLRKAFGRPIDPTLFIVPTIKKRVKLRKLTNLREFGMSLRTYLSFLLHPTLHVVKLQKYYFFPFPMQEGSLMLMSLQSRNLLMAPQRPHIKMRVSSILN